MTTPRPVTSPPAPRPPSRLLPLGTPSAGCHSRRRGWNPGTVPFAAPTISTDNSTVGGTIGDANNPTQAVNIVDSDTPAANLTVSAHVVESVRPARRQHHLHRQRRDPDGQVRTGRQGPRDGHVHGQGSPEQHRHHPGRSTPLRSAPASASGHYFYESSDLSSAVDVGNGYTLAVSSEDSTLRLYKQNQSGRPVATFDMSGAGDCWHRQRLRRPRGHGPRGQHALCQRVPEQQQLG